MEAFFSTEGPLLSDNFNLHQINMILARTMPMTKGRGHKDCHLTYFPPEVQWLSDTAGSMPLLWNGS